MEAYLKRLRGITLAAKANSNHWVVMDGSEQFGGSRAGASPMELILLGLMGCTGMDVVSILQKRRAPLEDFEMQATAERAEQHPKVYTKISLKYIFYGKDLKPSDVEMAINLSQEKYCSVMAMLRPSVEITYSYEIREKEGSPYAPQKPD